MKDSSVFTMDCPHLTESSVRVNKPIHFFVQWKGKLKHSLIGEVWNSWKGERGSLYIVCINRSLIHWMKIAILPRSENYVKEFRFKDLYVTKLYLINFAGKKMMICADTSIKKKTFVNGKSIKTNEAFLTNFFLS